MKKLIVLAAILTLALAGISYAGISASPHDLSTNTETDTGQICVFCHHPHRGYNASLGNALLWNIDDQTDTAYTVYSSVTMEGSDEAAVDSTAPQSFLCMACHDGAISAGTLVVKAGDSTGNTIDTTINLSATAALNDTDELANDHPVNFTYAGGADTDPDIVTAVGQTVTGDVSSNSYPLYSDKMQCATCHDVHAGGTDSADGDVNFMRGNIAASEICLDCHLK